MKVTKYIYAKFCQYSEGNIRYGVFNKETETLPEYKFVQAIEFETLTRDEVVALGINEFEEELFKLRQRIEAVENKKREMLALPMPEGECND